MKRLRIVETLEFYDGPQLVRAVDIYDIEYICLAVEQSAEGIKFLASRIDAELMDRYQAGQVDLRYVFLNPVRNARRYEFTIADGLEDIQRARPLGTVPATWLPLHGSFIAKSRAHSGDGVATLDIRIDGQWELSDFGYFPHRYTEVYSFIYALNDSRKTNDTKYQALFERYPWRGGYSAVNFYDDLYAVIPRKERLDVATIAYASPGTIKVRANKALAKQIEELVNRLSENHSGVRDVYADIYHQLFEMKLLSMSSRDKRLQGNDRQKVSHLFSRLSSALNLRHADKVERFSGGDPLTAVKILMAFYRRALELTEFVDQGRVSL
jgi:hypothetical protein